MYEVFTTASAPPGSKAALEAIEQRIGFVPNLAATMAGAPALVRGFEHLQDVLRSSTLTGAEREVVGLTVSHANTCPVSMAIHSTFALKQGLAPAVVVALRAGLPPADERLRVLHEFALALVEDRGHFDRARERAMEAAGFTPEQVLEVIAQVGYTSLANWVANLCDPPLDEAFTPQRWSPAG